MEARTFNDEDYDDDPDNVFDLDVSRDGKINATRLATIEVLSRKSIMGLDEFTLARKAIEKRIKKYDIEPLHLLFVPSVTSTKLAVVGFAFSTAGTKTTNAQVADFRIAEGSVDDIVLAAMALWQSVRALLPASTKTARVDLPSALVSAPRFGLFLALGFKPTRAGDAFKWTRDSERNMEIPDAAPVQKPSVLLRMQRQPAPAPAPAQEPAKRARPTHASDLVKLRKTLAKNQTVLADALASKDAEAIAVARGLVAGSEWRIAEAERNVRPVAPYTGPSDAERATAAAASARVVAEGATMFDAPPDLEAANPLYDAAASAAEPKHAPAAGKKRPVALMNACVACGGAAKMREPSSETHRGLAFCNAACQRRHRAAAAFSGENAAAAAQS